MSEEEKDIESSNLSNEASPLLSNTASASTNGDSTTNNGSIHVNGHDDHHHAVEEEEAVGSAVGVEGGASPAALSLDNSETNQTIQSNDGTTTSDGANTSNATTSSVEEMDRPWPATFERSISLLASPNMDASFVEKVTKSPKVTPYQVLRARRKKYKQQLTPEPPRSTGILPMGDDSFKYGITKIQSLDFAYNYSNKNKIDNNMEEDFLSLRKEQDKKNKLYRQKLLSKQSITSTTATSGSGKGSRIGEVDLIDAAAHSPGYTREKQTDKHREEMKKTGAGGTIDSHGVDISQKASFSQCIFNMANILMGVGLLGLPYVFAKAGWVGGFFVTVSFSSAAMWTSILLGRELNGDYRPCYTFTDNPYKSPTVGNTPQDRLMQPMSSFPEIAMRAFGHQGSFVISIVLYFELFSCLCIFIVTIGDHLYTLIPSISLAKHMINIAFLLTVPTALLRTPRLLSYLSAVGTFATICVVFSVLFSAISEGDISEQMSTIEEDTSPPYHILWKTTGLPAAFGLTAYTFSGHAIVPSIYSTMQRPQEFEKLIYNTFAIVVASCFVVAGSGYYMFGSTVEDQVTLSLEKASAIDIGSETSLKTLAWLMVLTAFSKFVLSAFPLALGLEEIFAPFLPSDNAMDIVSMLIKLILIGSAMLVAIYVPNFGFLCELVGLICTMIISIIFPAAAHLKLFGKHLPLHERFIDILFILAGTVMAIGGTYTTVKEHYGL